MIAPKYAHYILGNTISWTWFAQHGYTWSLHTNGVGGYWLNAQCKWWLFSLERYSWLIMRSDEKYKRANEVF